MALIARIICSALACLLLTPLTTSAMIASEREGSILIGDALNTAVVDRPVQSKRGATEPRLADVLCALVREGQGGLRSRCDIRRFDTQDAWWKSLQRRETQIAVVRSDQQYRVQTEELARAQRNRSAARGSLRALFSLDELPIVVLASRDSGIDSLRDPKAMQATHFLFGSEQDQTTLREVAKTALPGELNFKHVDNSDSVVDAICRQPGQSSLVWLIGGRANPALDALTDGRC
jgi:hypothetical protein